MTLAEIKARHERVDRHFKMYGGSVGNEGHTDAHDDRAWLIDKLERGLPYVEIGTEVDGVWKDAVALVKEIKGEQ